MLEKEKILKIADSKIGYLDLEQLRNLSTIDVKIHFDGSNYNVSYLKATKSNGGFYWLNTNIEKIPG